MPMRFFQPTTIDDHFKAFWSKIKTEVERFPQDQIVSADAEELSSQFAEKYKVECPVLGTDISYDAPPFSAETRYTVVAVHVPYSGCGDMFRCHGRSSPVMEVDADITPSFLVIRFRIDTTRVHDLPAEVQGTIKRINEGLNSINDSIKHLNPDLKTKAKFYISERKAQFAGHSRLLENLQKTGFNLRLRDDGSERIIVPVKPKQIKIAQAQSAKSPQNYELSLADYDAILQVIRDMMTVCERSPSAFTNMVEEHLRTVLLVALNGMFKGDATAETFNGAGKTDILIKVNGNNIFIAECLIWDGQEHFKKKLTEQLFTYSTWHDSKLAAIVFNRKKNFSASVEKMRETAAGLDNVVAPMSYGVPNGCRHKLRRTDDPQKEFLLTCLAFEVPA